MRLTQTLSRLIIMYLFHSISISACGSEIPKLKWIVLVYCLKLSKQIISRANLEKHSRNLVMCVFVCWFFSFFFALFSPRTHHYLYFIFIWLGKRRRKRKRKRNRKRNIEKQMPGLVNSCRLGLSEEIPSIIRKSSEQEPKSKPICSMKI